MCNERRGARAGRVPAWMALVSGVLIATPSEASAQGREAPIGFEFWGNSGWSIAPLSGLSVRIGVALRAAGFIAIGAEMLGEIGTRNGSIGVRFGGGPIVTVQFGSLAGWTYFEPMLSIGTHFTTEDNKTWVDPFARATLALAVNSFRIGLAVTAGPHVPIAPPTPTGLCLDVSLTAQRYF